MIIMRTTEYSVRAITYLAKHSNGKNVMVKDLAKKEKIPYHYAAKILQLMGKYGFVDSFKSRGGGFRITKYARESSVMDIINLIQGNIKLDTCLFNFSDCESEKPCPFCEKWVGISEQINDLIFNQTIDDLARQFQD